MLLLWIAALGGRPEPRLAAVRSLHRAQEGGVASGSGGGKGSGGGAADQASVLQQVEQWLQRPHRWSAAGSDAAGGGAGGAEVDGGAAGLARSLEAAAGSLNHALVVVAAQAVEELCREAPGLRQRLRSSGVSPPLMAYLDLASPLLLPGGGGVERPSAGVVVAGCAGALAALTALAGDDPGRLELASHGVVRRCVRWLGDAANGRRPRVSCCAAQLLGELCVLDGPRAQLATKNGMEALLHALDAAGSDEASQGAIVRCLSALSAGASPAASAAFKESGTLPVLLRLLSNDGPCTEATGHAAQALAQLSALQSAKEELLRVGAVASLLRCLAAGPSSPVAHAAAHALGNMCGHEATGREILRMQGPTSIQVLLGLLRGGVGPATPMALRVVVNMAAHPALRPGLISAGALDALLPFLGVRASPHWTSGGRAASPPRSPGGSPHAGSAPPRSEGLGLGPGGVAGPGGGGSLLVAGVEDEVGSPHELALLALVRCMAISGMGGPAAQGALLSGPVLQVLLEAAAAPLPQMPVAAAVGGLGGSASVALGGAGAVGGLLVAPAAGDGAARVSLPPSVAVVVEATETLADLSKGSAGALRMLEVQAHLALLQRLLAIIASAPGAQVASLDGVPRRLLDACVRGLANVSMAVPAHPDLRLARVHEALLHVLLAFGVAVKPGVLALQALCALATDSNCARDLLSLGLLPPVVKALEGLAAAQHLRRGSALAASAAPGAAAADSAATRGGGSLGVGPADGTASAFAAAATTGRILGGGWHSPAVEVEVAHLLGLLLQNISAHKALASRAVEGGAVKAICEWLGACAANGDVEGAVLCCATLCLLGDGDLAALADMVRYDGMDRLVDMLHPRWATAALVPSTVASAVAVACRWGASAQAFRMRGGIPALADTLLGAHGLACCRPVVNAIRALVANDPPSSREIRTTNTVIALGTQLQLLPNNDPRSGLIRDILRLLGEDPDTAMRLANTKNTSALATAHALAMEAGGHGAGAGGAQGGGGGGGGGSTAGSHHGHHRHHHHHHHRDGGGGSPMRVSGSGTGGGYSSGGGGRKHHSPHHHHHSPPHASLSHGLGPGAAASGFTSDSSGGVGRIQRRRTSQSLGLGDGGGSGDWSPPAALGPAVGGMLTLADMLGGTSYKSLRRASLQQLARRLDADDFSDAEEDVEDYIAGLEEDDRSSSQALTPAASGAADAVASLPPDLALQQDPASQPQSATSPPGSGGGAAANTNPKAGPTSAVAAAAPAGPSPFTTNGAAAEHPARPAPTPTPTPAVAPPAAPSPPPPTPPPPAAAPFQPQSPPPPQAVVLAKPARAGLGTGGAGSGSVAGTSASEEDAVDVASLSEAAFIKAPPRAAQPAPAVPLSSPVQLSPPSAPTAGSPLPPRPSPQLQAPAPSPAVDAAAAEYAAVMRQQHEALERQIAELRQQLEAQQRAMAAQLQLQQQQPQIPAAALAQAPAPTGNAAADEEAARRRWEEEEEQRWQADRLWEQEQDAARQRQSQQQRQQQRRNPVISTLAAVNPLRLFRRGPKQQEHPRQQEQQPAPLPHPQPVAAAAPPVLLQPQPQQGGSSRQSFQLDGDEIVFWEPGQS
ncbi:hypothetical protein HXX76_003569 [Chlamydomonas incerta]|uniref:Uncharacterized protein n=1 Tax=Chlamydomonas incerta TaxID=51695 RepID=A0A835W4W9_CHLIN|nr:hypothetical protein HXX76_003569 [Chlamydomonas incerta]|eukprot:KAG2440712.1 hypothetical protein HXX76_003569 [Chlamydomonas incerta]